MEERYRVLRDKSGLTKALILLEMLRGAKKLREIANAVGVSTQAVSEYLHEMIEESLITEDLKITVNGVEFLEQKIRGLELFLKEASRKLYMIRVIDAIADEDISEGDEVGLFMRNGRVMAHHAKEDSVGIAINSAVKGEDVGVTSLRGIIRIDRGRIKICVLPSISEGGSRKVDTDRIREILKRYEVRVAYGSVAIAVFNKLGIGDFIEFASSYVCVDCALKGLDVIMLVSKDYLPYVIREINSLGYEIEYDIEII